MGQFQEVSSMLEENQWGQEVTFPDPPRCFQCFHHLQPLKSYTFTFRAMYITLETFKLDMNHMTWLLLMAPGYLGPSLGPTWFVKLQVLTHPHMVTDHLLYAGTLDLLGDPGCSSTAQVPGSLSGEEELEEAGRMMEVQYRWAPST